MVLFHFKSLHPLLKVERRCFCFLDECSTLHSEWCTLWISILRTAITVVSFRVTGAITSQNEALGEFYGLDRCKPSTNSFKPKKGYPNHSRVSDVFWPSFFHHVNFTLKWDHRCWSSIYLPGEWFTMVLFHFKSLHPLLKVERRCFGFLDECCNIRYARCNIRPKSRSSAVRLLEVGAGIWHGTVPWWNTLQGR